MDHNSRIEVIGGLRVCRCEIATCVRTNAFPQPRFIGLPGDTWNEVIRGRNKPDFDDLCELRDEVAAN